MNSISEQAFAVWATSHGLELKSKYSHSPPVVTFPGEIDSRFWVIPPKAEQRPYFLMQFLELMGEWQRCYVWRQHGGWPAAENIDPGRPGDVTEFEILRGLGMPLGTPDVVVFDRFELGKLLTLLFTTTIFGWSVGEDLLVVPDHGRQLIDVSHHDVVHVSFPASDGKQSMNRWIARMSEEGFELPTQPPDATFKRPTWME